jgi:hypothetical protein
VAPKTTNVAFSGLTVVLSADLGCDALDGLAAPERRLLFMTGNRPEVLDPALVRS